VNDVDIGADAYGRVHNTTRGWQYGNINDGIDEASDGDILIADPGTYEEKVDFDGRAITLRSADPCDPCTVAETIINGNDLGYTVRFDSSEDSGSVLKGFTITNPLGSGILCSNASPTIKNCIIENTNATGFECCGVASPIVTNSIIRGNGGPGIMSSGSGSVPTICNNLIYDNNYYGIQVWWGGSAEITNTTIVGNTSRGISHSSSGSTTVKNCIVWENGDDLYGCDATYSCIEDTDSEPTNIHTDPCFVDAANDDYHIKAISQCTEAGDPCGTYNGTDIDGDDRVTGVYVDMGADEFSGVFNLDQEIWYDTIQDAIDDASSGDEIVAYPGTYYESVDFDGKAITLRSTDPNDWDVVEATIIDATGKSENAVTFENDEDENTILSGFTITGATGDLRRGIDCSETTPMISNCRIIENKYGIICSGDGYQPSPSINNCIIQSNDIVGLMLYGFNGGTVSNCVLKYNGYCGVAFDHHNGTITNCTISNNNTPTSDGVGIHCYSSDTTVKNCNIYDNGSNGVYCEYYSSPIITNCTIVNNEPGGLYVDGLSSVTADSSILWDNETQITGSGQATVSYSDVYGGWPGEGNIDTDPCFADAANDDYHLNMNSPCINVGDPCYCPSSGETDIDGDERVIGGRVDMGSDETCGRVYNNNIPDMWYCDIQSAIYEAAGGDKIVALEDTYEEQIDFLGKAITVRSTDPCDWDVVQATIINPNISNGKAVCFQTSESASSVLRGFTITNPVGFGILCSNNASPTIKNCIIENANGAGLECIGSPIVINNIIRGNDSGITSTLAGSVPSIRNNLIYDNSYGIKTWYGGSAEITNNTIVGNTSYGIQKFTGGTDPTITNCILWGNGTQIHSDFEDDITYSCIQNWDFGGVGNIGDDPCFVDPCSNDYHLSLNSPCINEGDPCYTPDPGETDIDGELRIMGEYVDMGADESDLLSSYWKFDDESGQIAIDSSGSNDGQLGSTSGTDDSDPTWTTGIIDGALEFDGGDDFVEMTDYKGVIGTEARSCTAWIQTDAPGDILTWGDMSGQWWDFYISLSGNLRVAINGGAIKGTEDLRDSEWHHVAAAWDPSWDSCSEVIDNCVCNSKLYVDGEQITTTTPSGKHLGVNTDSDMDVKVGLLSSTNARYFDGKIDEVRVFKRALSSDEIEELYEAGQE
jgi:hypothetical protein